MIVKQVHIHGFHLLLEQPHIADITLAWLCLRQTVVSRCALMHLVRACLVEVVVLFVLTESVDARLGVLGIIISCLCTADRHSLRLIISRRFMLILRGCEVTNDSDHPRALVVLSEAFP